MNHICLTHQQPIILICIEPKCSSNRPSCLLCLDSLHQKHQIVSIQYFLHFLKEKLQINRSNPDKAVILKELNKAKDELMHRIQMIKNKMIGLLGECEDKIQKYFSSIYHSFAVDSHETIIHMLDKSCTSAKISQLLEEVNSIQGITLGSFKQTQTILYTSMRIFKEQIAQAAGQCTTNIEKVKKSFDSFTICKPKQFTKSFSQQKIQKSFLSLNDSLRILKRHNGFGGYPMCLTERPFDPINNKITFHVKRIEHLKKKSICLGVCLYNVVKSSNFSNCVGFNKGIYAIDQSYSYSLGDEQTSIASWNHHDQTFNQSSVGNSNLVGWSFKEGDKIQIEIDYFNAVVLFIKNGSQNWEDEEESQVYEMPIKLDGTPLYGFVSQQTKGDEVQLIC